MYEPNVINSSSKSGPAVESTGDIPLSKNDNLSMSQSGQLPIKGVEELLNISTKAAVDMAVSKGGEAIASAGGSTVSTAAGGPAGTVIFKVADKGIKLAKKAATEFVSNLKNNSKDNDGGMKWVLLLIGGIVGVTLTIMLPFLVILSVLASVADQLELPSVRSEIRYENICFLEEEVSNYEDT